MAEDNVHAQVIRFTGDFSEIRQQIAQLRQELSQGIGVGVGGAATRGVAAGTASAATVAGSVVASSVGVTPAAMVTEDSRRDARLQTAAAVSSARVSSAADVLPVLARRVLNIPNAAQAYMGSSIGGGSYAYGGGYGGGVSAGPVAGYGGGLPMLPGSTAIMPSGGALAGGESLPPGVPPVINIPGNGGYGGGGGSGQSFWSQAGSLAMTRIPRPLWRVGAGLAYAGIGEESARINMQNSLASNYGGIRGEYDIQQRYSDSLNSMTLGLGGIVDYYTGNRRGAAQSAMAATDEQERQFNARWASRDSAASDSIAAARIGADPQGQIYANNDSFNLWTAERNREYAREAERINQLPISQQDKQSRLNAGAADTNKEIQSRWQLTWAQDEAIRRQGESEMSGFGYATRSANASGINDQESGIQAIMGEYEPEKIRNENSTTRMLAIDDLESAKIDAFNRRYNRENLSVRTGALGATAANLATAQGNSFSAGLYQTLASGAQSLLNGRPENFQSTLNQAVSSVAAYLGTAGLQAQDTQGEANVASLSSQGLSFGAARLQVQNRLTTQLRGAGPAASAYQSLAAAQLSGITRAEGLYNQGAAIGESVSAAQAMGSEPGGYEYTARVRGEYGNAMLAAAGAATPQARDAYLRTGLNHLTALQRDQQNVGTSQEVAPGTVGPGFGGTGDQQQADRELIEAIKNLTEALTNNGGGAGGDFGDSGASSLSDF